VDPDLLQTLKDQYNPNRIVARKNSVSIDIRSIACLRDGIWLNCDVITFFLEWWRERTGGGGGTEKKLPNLDNNPKCWYTDSFFFAKLTEDGYNYAQVARWTRTIDVFKFDKMIIPINEGNKHWYLAVVNFRDKLTEVYDSLGGQRPSIHGVLCKWLCDEHLDKHGVQLALDDWKIKKTRSCRIPKQSNEYDCGVFMCLYATYSSIDAPFNFTQKDIILARQFMVQLIYNSGKAAGLVH